MIERIKENEDRFDKILEIVKNLENVLSIFEKSQNDLLLLSRYYESKNWLKDKEALENNQITRIKAGVLSEDGLWNMFSDIDEIIYTMKKVIEKYERIK